MTLKEVIIMTKYLQLMNRVMSNGIETPDRTGVGCRKVFNAQMTYNQDQFPSSVSRPMGLKFAWEEMKLFLSGDTDTTKLEAQGINFWKAHTSREFLDSRGLQHLPVGSLGKSYSHQFALQVDHLIKGLRDDPFSRRHAIDLWGVVDQAEMPLLPCWWRSNWSVQPSDIGGPILHLKLYSRSNDLLFGYHQAAMQYRLFQIALAKMLGFRVGLMVCDFWDIHIYTNQFDYVKELLLREEGLAGTVELNKEVNSLEDILQLSHTDFERIGYKPNREPFKTPRPEVAV